jgi:hypothetical protein
MASDFEVAAAARTSYAKQFPGMYSHGIFKGIGHNVPQKTSEAFAKLSSKSTVIDWRHPG